ncbi:MAG: hypothetical protein JWQ57_4467 [Mucilaginibacter sp.]|jgi:hypothetical protein|nr:hypothetical protein [Mucilaginibacter sp.]
MSVGEGLESFYRGFEASRVLISPCSLSKQLSRSFTSINKIMEGVKPKKSMPRRYKVL